MQNISLYTGTTLALVFLVSPSYAIVNCMFMGQLMVTETTANKNAPKVVNAREETSRG